MHFGLLALVVFQCNFTIIHNLLIDNALGIEEGIKKAEAPHLSIRKMNICTACRCKNVFDMCFYSVIHFSFFVINRLVNSDVTNVLKLLFKINDLSIKY